MVCMDMLVHRRSTVEGMSPEYRPRGMASEPVKISPAVARLSLGVSGKARGAENRERSGAYVSDFRGPCNAAGRVQGRPQ